MAAPGQDRPAFESAIQALEAEVANAAVHGLIEGSLRQVYSRRIRELADELRDRAMAGRISWADAASEAQEIRNAVMDLIRGRSTTFGKAVAESMKPEGKTLNELIARKTLQRHGPKANFRNLTEIQQNQIFADIVESAGKSDPRTNRLMRHVSRAGRALIVLSVAVSVYNVAVAEDKVSAAGREVAVTGAGIGGGLAGGALAGLACGPGAPVCVAVGAFVGGAMAAFGVDYFW